MHRVHTYLSASFAAIFLAAVLMAIPVFSSSSSYVIAPTQGLVRDPSSYTLSPLRTSGTKIYDSSNNEVKLWGCDVILGDWSQYTSTDMNWIKSKGFNAVRIEVSWGRLEPNSPTEISTTQLTSYPCNLDHMVQIATDAELYVWIMLGMSPTYHTPSWLSSGTIYASGSTSGGTFNFLDTNAQTGIYNLYYFLSSRYKSYSNVMFEGLNELCCNTGDTTEMAGFRAWNDKWMRGVEDGEAGSGITHLKIIEFLENYGNPNLTQKLHLYPPYYDGTHSNVLLATHDYPIVHDSYWIGQTNTYCSTIYNACSAVNCPWMDTEFSQAEGGTQSSLNAACNAMKSNGIAGWGYFAYDQVGGSDYGYNYCINGAYSSSLLAILQPYMTQPT
jgi:hypothetical protein